MQSLTPLRHRQTFLFPVVPTSLSCFEQNRQLADDEISISIQTCRHMNRINSNLSEPSIGVLNIYHHLQANWARWDLNPEPTDMSPLL